MRDGILSDNVIKTKNPQYFNLDIGTRHGLQPTFLQRHIFQGIKPPRETRTRVRTPIRPIHDIKNMSYLTKIDENMAIQHYKDELNNYNFSRITDRRNFVDLAPLNEILSTRMRQTLKSVAQGDDLVDVLNRIFPNGNVGKMTDGEVLSKLNNLYRDSPDDLENIQMSYEKIGRNISF